MGIMGVGQKIKRVGLMIFAACFALMPAGRVSAEDEEAAKIVKIASHGALGLALDEEGNVYQWGSEYGINFGTEMGNKIHYNLEKVGGLPKVKDIASGLSSFALTEGGEVYAWGASGYTGLGLATSAADMLNLVTEPQKLPLQNIEKIWTGNCYTYAQDSAGKFYVWGYDRGRYLDLLTGNNGEHFYTPIEYPLSPEIKEIAVGYTSAFGLTANGDVYAWGANSDDLGVGMETSVFSGTVAPVKIETLGNIKSIAAGVSKAMAVDNEGRVYLWGGSNSNNYMMLENGETGDSILNTQRVLSPMKVKDLEGIKAVSTNSMYAALSDDGEVSVWGYANNISQDGKDGYFEDFQDAGIPNVVQVVDAGSEIILLTENGSIYEWGMIYREDIKTEADIEDPSWVFGARNIVMATEPTLLYGEGEEKVEAAAKPAESEGGNVTIWIILAVIGGLIMVGSGVMLVLYLKTKKGNVTI